MAVEDVREGPQEISFDGGTKRLSNDKVVSYIARDAGHPISVGVHTSTTETGGTLYTITMSGDDVSLSYQ